MNHDSIYRLRTLEIVFSNNRCNIISSLNILINELILNNIVIKLISDKQQEVRFPLWIFLGTKFMVC
jgi:hypothetical protein